MAVKQMPTDLSGVGCWQISCLLFRKWPLPTPRVNKQRSEISALYLAHQNTLIKLLCRMVGCYQTAEDLAQEAYLKVSGAAQSRIIRHPQPFLYQTARNLALDYLRRQKIREKNQNDVEDEIGCLAVPDSTPTPDLVAEASQELKTLLSILAELPERRREMLILNKLHGWKYAKIADHFGISKSAVEKNIRIALAHCLEAKSGPQQ